MKLSELIALLQDNLNKYGDEKILFVDYEGLYLYFEKFVNNKESMSLIHEIWLN